MSREPELAGQTVVVIGGSSGIGFETARLARSEGADVVLVVGAADIDALAVHLMTNTAITGATYDIDGGQQLVEGGALRPTRRLQAAPMSLATRSLW